MNTPDAGTEVSETPSQPITQSSTKKAPLGLIIVAVILIVAAAFGGYFYEHHKAAQRQTSDQSQINGLNADILSLNQKTADLEANNGSRTLTITQWGVSLALTQPIYNATYVYDTKTNLGNAVFLSTATLNASKECQAYNAQGSIPVADSRPAFQWIRRFTLNQATSLEEGGPMITAQQAAVQAPNQYIKIGNYVYTYGHGNGEPCQDQPAGLTGDFNDAFLTIFQTSQTP